MKHSYHNGNSPITQKRAALMNIIKEIQFVMPFKGKSIGTTISGTLESVCISFRRTKNIFIEKHCVR